MVAPAVAAAGISAGASLLGGLFGSSSAKKANKAAAAEAQANRDFQERMAKNAHQYEVADLKAAGLNPILSATGGAGAATPGGSMAPVQNEADSASRSSSAASAAALATAQLQNTKADTALKEASSVSALSSAKSADANAALTNTTNVQKSMLSPLYQKGGDIVQGGSDAMDSLLDSLGSNSAKSVPMPGPPSSFSQKFKLPTREENFEKMRNVPWNKNK